MVAQGLHLRVSCNVSVSLPRDFKGSSFGSLTPFVQPTKWNPIVVSPTHYQASCRHRYNSGHFLYARTAHKGEVLNTDSGEPESKTRRKNLAVFVSGGGSNFKSIHLATLNGAVLGDVVVLVTNKRDCGGAAYARESGIPVVLFPRSKEEPEGLSADNLVTTLRKFKVDFTLLAGYLKLIPVELVREYPKRILNIHPSLLPAFGGKGYYGMKVHKAVIASGARYSGPTIHFVDEQYDTGKILAQRVVPVRAFDTPEELAARVLLEEHRLYVDVVAALCEDRITWRDDGVPVIHSKEDPNQYC